MKATSKTDEVIDILKQAVTVVNLIEYSLREIERADNKSGKADKVIAAYQSNLDYCNSCKTTAKDVYDEYWEICPSVESLPKCAKALAARFENVGIPVWIYDPHSKYQKQIDEKIWDMEKQGIIAKEQASDLMCLFDLLASWVMAWVFRVQNILKEMGVEPLSLQTDKPQETGYEAKNKPTLPEVLNTDEAKKIFSKAVKVGLMQPLSNGSGYQWNRSNAMLAYLCGKIYCGDRLKKDMVSKEWELKRGETFFPETALMSFFVNKEKQAIKNLGQSRLQMQRPPKGYKDIDRLFDEAT